MKKIISLLFILFSCAEIDHSSIQNKEEAMLILEKTKGQAYSQFKPLFKNDPELFLKAISLDLFLWDQMSFDLSFQQKELKYKILNTNEHDFQLNQKKLIDDNPFFFYLIAQGSDDDLEELSRYALSKIAQIKADEKISMIDLCKKAIDMDFRAIRLLHRKSVDLDLLKYTLKRINGSQEIKDENISEIILKYMDQYPWLIQYATTKIKRELAHELIQRSLMIDDIDPTNDHIVDVILDHDLYWKDHRNMRRILSHSKTNRIKLLTRILGDYDMHQDERSLFVQAVEKNPFLVVYCDVIEDDFCGSSNDQDLLFRSLKKIYQSEDSLLNLCEKTKENDRFFNHVCKRKLTDLEDAPLSIGDKISLGINLSDRDLGKYSILELEQMLNQSLKHEKISELNLLDQTLIFIKKHGIEFDLLRYVLGFFNEYESKKIVKAFFDKRIEKINPMSFDRYIQLSQLFIEESKNHPVILNTIHEELMLKFGQNDDFLIANPELVSQFSPLMLKNTNLLDHILHKLKDQKEKVDYINKLMSGNIHIFFLIPDHLLYDHHVLSQLEINGKAFNQASCYFDLKKVEDHQRDDFMMAALEKQISCEKQWIDLIDDAFVLKYAGQKRQTIMEMEYVQNKPALQKKILALFIGDDHYKLSLKEIYSVFLDKLFNNEDYLISTFYAHVMGRKVDQNIQANLLFKWANLYFKELLKDRDMILKFSMFKVFNFCNLPKKFQNDYKIINDIIDGLEKSDRIECLSDRMKDEFDITYRLMNVNHEWFQYFSEKMRSHTDLIYLALENDPTMIKYVPAQVLKDQKFLLNILKNVKFKDDDLLFLLDEKEKNDISLVKEIAQNNPAIIRFVNEEMKNDLELAKIVLKQDLLYIQFLGNQLLRQKEIVDFFVEQPVEIKQFFYMCHLFEEKELEREDLAMKILYIDEYCFGHLPKHLQIDEKFIFKIIQKKPSIIQHIDPALLNKKDFVMKILYSKTDIYQYLPTHLKLDKEIRILSLMMNLQNQKYMTQKLLNDPDIQDILSGARQDQSLYE